MHHIYQTEGFIIGGMPVNEAGKYITVYTGDLGLIRALAQGVRNLRSKLRYSLETLSYSKISFVKGREIWRIVNAEKETAGSTAAKDPEKRKIMAGMASLLRRFVGREVIDRRISDDIKRVIVFLDNNPFTAGDLRMTEILYAFRLFFYLGYISPDENTREAVNFTEWNKEMIGSHDKRRENLLAHINKAVKESHL